MTEHTTGWGCSDCGRVWEGPEDKSFAKRNSGRDNRPVQQRCRACAAIKDRELAARRSARTDEEIEAARQEAGTSWCSFHKRQEPVEAFGVARRIRNGCQPICRAGQKEKYAESRKAREAASC